MRMTEHRAAEGVEQKYAEMSFMLGFFFALLA